MKGLYYVTVVPVTHAQPVIYKCESWQLQQGFLVMTDCLIEYEPNVIDVYLIPGTMMTAVLVENPKES